MSANDYEDDELAEIRRRRLEQYKEEAKKRELQKQLEAQKQALLRKILTEKARERLNNVKLVRPDLASLVEEQLIALAQTGRISVPIGEDVVKTILSELYTRTHREPKIRFKRK
ncbi:MAG: DNA-binding protein [Desulfurococcales archaeon]|nr:DNA-binding protein [Desulfurococcales archaeon]